MLRFRAFDVNFELTNGIVFYRAGGIICGSQQPVYEAGKYFIVSDILQLFQECFFILPADLRVRSIGHVREESVGAVHFLNLTKVYDV